MLWDTWIQGPLGITEFPSPQPGNLCPSPRYLSLGGVRGFLEEVAFKVDLKAQEDFCSGARRAMEGRRCLGRASSCSTAPTPCPLTPVWQAGSSCDLGVLDVLQGEFGAGLHRADGGARPAAGAEFSAG